MKTQDPGNMCQDPKPNLLSQCRSSICFPVWQWTGDSWLRSQESFECLISRTFKTQGVPGCRHSLGSPQWMIFHQPRAAPFYWFDPLGKALTRLLPDTLYQLKKSVKHLGGTRHLDKSRRSDKSVQSDELGRPGSTVLGDKPVRCGKTIQLASSRHWVSSGQFGVSVHSGKSRQADKSRRSVPLGQSTKSRQPKIANQDDSKYHQAIDPLDHTDGKSSANHPHTVLADLDELVSSSEDRRDCLRSKSKSSRYSSPAKSSLSHRSHCSRRSRSWSRKSSTHSRRRRKASSSWSRYYLYSRSRSRSRSRSLNHRHHSHKRSKRSCLIRDRDVHIHCILTVPGISPDHAYMVVTDLDLPLF